MTANTASADTHGEIGVPETVPLVYPGLHRVHDVEVKGKPKGSLDDDQTVSPRSI